MHPSHLTCITIFKIMRHIGPWLWVGALTKLWFVFPVVCFIHVLNWSNFSRAAVAWQRSVASCWLDACAVARKYFATSHTLCIFSTRQTVASCGESTCTVMTRLHWRYLLRFQIARVNYGDSVAIWIASSLREIAAKIEAKIASVNGPFTWKLEQPQSGTQLL